MFSRLTACPSVSYALFVPELIGEPLEPDRAKKLRDWLAKPEAHTLRTVIAAKLRLKKELAIAAAMAADGVNGYDLLSKAEMRDAHRMQYALDLLDLIANPDTPLETIKLKL